MNTNETIDNHKYLSLRAVRKNVTVITTRRRGKAIAILLKIKLSILKLFFYRNKLIGMGIK